MKSNFLLLTFLFTFILIGCSDDDSTTSPTPNTGNCTELTADFLEKGEAFTIAMASVFTGGDMDANACSAYATSAQAFLDGGCKLCESNDVACADDGSNEDTCCDEIDQVGIDQISAMCGG